MLQIYNSLSGEKEPFKPLVEGQVRIYVCGMTVYDYCHIGHARVMVAFDVVTRYLRHKGYQVTYVRNITDVDDKIFNRANQNNESYEQLTERFIKAMHEDERRLKVLAPDLEPRATAHMSEIIAMVETLLEKGYAYYADNGDVYYRVNRFAGYGKLSNKNLEELRAGERVEVAQAKENPLDFALWKAAKAGEAAWPSPWGPGRPGWHIECSAMSTSCLGNSFDIHGGGPDLKFPHHENEIAQAEAATGEPYVGTWMHAGAVRVDNEKMSKSLGNFFTIREVLQKYDPEVVRYLLIASHYRSPINYSEDNLRQAEQALERFYTALRQADEVNLPADAAVDSDIARYRGRFEEAMDDDFNTPQALALMFELVRDINKAAPGTTELLALLREFGAILGLLQQPPEQFLQASGNLALSSERVEQLIAERDSARAGKNWAKADEIRDFLLTQGIVLDDGRGGTRWRRKTAES